MRTLWFARGKRTLTRTLRAEMLEQRDVPATYYVAPTGVNANDRGLSPTTPVRDIQFAVNRAAAANEADTTIRVAGGTYSFNQSLVPSTANGGKATVFAINTRLTLLGGFNTADWENSDPAANPTIIDGGGQARGVVVVGLGPAGKTNLVMDGFTVQNGLGTRNANDPNSNAFLYGEGGGIQINFGGEQNNPNTTKLTNLVIRNNTARGADTEGVTFEGNRTFNYGGFGVGGGLFATFVKTLILDQITIDGNQAVGGRGSRMAGAALGGGVWLDNTGTTATNITITNNKVVGGSTGGVNDGSDTGGRNPEAFGGGIVVRSEFGNLGKSTANFNGVTISNNQAIGASTTSTDPASRGGNAVGAGFTGEYSNITLANALIQNNTATAGKGYISGSADGGGVRTFNDQLTLDRAVVTGNVATAGDVTVVNSGSRYGPSGGGGVYLTNFDTRAPRQNVIRNSVIADNKVLFPAGGTGDQGLLGGGGGGLWVQGSKVSVESTTFARNLTDDRMIFAMAIQTLADGVSAWSDGGAKTDLTVRNSIISDHKNNSQAQSKTITPAISTKPNTDTRLVTVLYANNDKNDDSDVPSNAFFPPGNYPQRDVLQAASVGYAATNSGTSVAFGLAAASPAVNASTGTAPGVDLFNRARTGTADLGAIEAGSGGTLGPVAPVPGNKRPTISAIADQTTPAGQPTAPIAFTVGDAETPVGALTIEFTSSNTTVVPANGFTLGGTGANRTVVIAPAAGKNDVSTITVVVRDSDGGATTTTFKLTAGNPTPPRLVGYPQFGVAADRGGSTEVSLLNADKTVRRTVDAFPGYTGGIRTAAADFNADGVADLVVGTGPGGASRVRVLDGASGTELFATGPFEASFTGGIYVTAGDINADGKADLVITPDEGGGPRVDVYSGAGFGKIATFFGIGDTNFRGGARAAVGDVNGDGTGDLVVAAGFGGGPRVAVFDGNSVVGGNPRTLFNDFFAFEQTLRNGVFITAGDIDGDGKADVVAGGGPGGGPRVLAISAADLLSSGGGTLTPLANFFAGDTNNRGGVRVGVKNLDGDVKADLVTGSGTGGGSRVTGYLGSGLTGGGQGPAFDYDAFPGYTGGVFVG